MAYFIGIDLHKRTSQISVLDGDTDLYVLRKSILSKPARFKEVLAPYAGAKVLLESSTYSRWLAPYLRSLGYDVDVCDPNNPLTYASRPANCKNDIKDADALAFARRRGHYTKIREPNEEQRPIAELLGTRNSQVVRRTAAVNRVRALYAARGIELAAGDAAQFWSRVKRLPVNERVPAAEPLLDELAMLEDLVTASEKKIEELAATHAVALRLRTMPGVGPIVSLSFYVKIGDPSRFKSAHQVESYLGLVPTIHASAEAGRGGRISRRGSSTVRSLMIQAAWSHVGSNDPRAQPTKEWFLQLEKRSGTRQAITAVARKLAGILYVMWRDGTDFQLREPKPLREKPADRASTRARRYQLKSSGPSTTPG
jgi:transposase